MKRDQPRRAVFSVLMLAIALPAVAAGAELFRHENSPQNLRALFEQMHHAVHAKQDVKQAAALFQSLTPDEVRVRKALKDNAGPDTIQQIVDMHRKSGAPEEAVRKLARAEQKEVQVHGASTEEILRYQDGSLAMREFPSGARRIAKQALRRGMTFYEVEYVVPGKDSGVKYHLLYWDGARWTMLGPVWRVLKK